MKLKPLARTRSPGSISPAEVYCGLAVALLLGNSFVLSPAPAAKWPLQTEKPQQAKIPVATIQFMPDFNGVCRRLFFHNDTGHFQEGGTVHCYRQCDETCFSADTDIVSTAGVARAVGKPRAASH
jgi:hypothetical protein